MPKIDLIRSDLQFRYLSILTIAVCCMLLFVFMLMLGLSTTAQSGANHKAKIGFVILGDIHDQGWNSSHYQGMRAACEDFNVELIVKDKIPINSGMCPKAVQELVDQGVEMIYLGSASYGPELKFMLPNLRQIAFASMAETLRGRNFTAYLFRMYQARYLAGALAGMRTKSNVVGYIAAHRNSEVNRGINAFALGVKEVNPQAQVAVLYTNSWQNEEIERTHAEFLIQQIKADVLMYHQDDHTVAEVAERLGVDYISSLQVLDYPSEHNLGAVICHLDQYYKNIVQLFLKGELNTISHLWQGIESGIVDLEIVSPAVTPQMKETIERLRSELKTHRVIFSGEIVDNLGVKHCKSDESISDKALIDRIDWLIQGCLELN